MSQEQFFLTAKYKLGLVHCKTGKPEITYNMTGHLFLWFKNTEQSTQTLFHFLKYLKLCDFGYRRYCMVARWYDFMFEWQKQYLTPNQGKPNQGKQMSPLFFYM